MAQSLASQLPLLLVLAGLILGIAETVIPGAHFFVVGAALFFAGLVGLVFPPAVNIFVLPFLVVVFAGVTLYAYRRTGITDGTGMAQTSDSDSLKGTTGRVTELVTPTDGEVKLQSGGFDPYYQARTIEGEIEEGAEVIVLDPGGGNILTVESLETEQDEIDRELELERDR